MTNKNIYGVISVIILNDGTDEIFNIHHSAKQVTSESTLEGMINSLIGWFDDTDKQLEYEANLAGWSVRQERESERDYRSYYVKWHLTTSREAVIKSNYDEIVSEHDASDNIIVPPTQFIGYRDFIYAIEDMMLHNIPKPNKLDTYRRYKETIAKILAKEHIEN